MACARRRRGPPAVVPLDALLAFKMKAHGPKDLMDAAMLVLLHPRIRTPALDLAQAYRTEERFRAWLEDPRLARDAEAILAAETRAKGPPRAACPRTPLPQTGSRSSARQLPAPSQGRRGAWR